LKLINELAAAAIPRGRSRGLTAVPRVDASSEALADAAFAFANAIDR
jgi:hypothetical protein